jgi:hypothetical protein
VPEITHEFKQDRALFESTARAHTAKHAVDSKNATIRGQQQQQEMSSMPGAQNAEEKGQINGASVQNAVACVPEEEAEDESDQEEDLKHLWGELPSRRHACVRARARTHTQTHTHSHTHINAHTEKHSRRSLMARSLSSSPFLFAFLLPLTL